MHKPTDPKQAAEDVRADFWANRGLPVDPIQISRRMGVEVKEGSLPDSVSGALRKLPGAAPEILLERSDHKNRKRFTCAHELGHYVRRAGEDEFEYVDYRSPLASEGFAPEEVFANQFAANLLMPEDEVRKAAKGSSPLWRLAQSFGVSPEAMKFRLKNLRIPFDEE